MKARAAVLFEARRKLSIEPVKVSDSRAGEVLVRMAAGMGSFYGSARPRIDIPKLMDLYRAGKLKLDELLTHTDPLEQINEAHQALERGEVARSVVTF